MTGSLTGHDRADKTAVGGTVALRGFPKGLAGGADLKQKKSVEDYLKTIYILSRKKDVHGADIAKEIGVSRPTVCVSLKALAEEGYILMNDAHEVHLTEKGMQIAKETYERHNTFCRLLTGLGVDEKTAASDACEMEHAASAESYQALKTLITDGNGGI